MNYELKVGGRVEFVLTDTDTICSGEIIDVRDIEKTERFGFLWLRKRTVTKRYYLVRRTVVGLLTGYYYDKLTFIQIGDIINPRQNA